MSQASTSLKSVASLTCLSLGQMVLQLAFQWWLARQFGTTSEMDAFVAASALPMVVSGLLAGTFGAAFVPVFVDVREQAGEPAARSLAIQLTCWLFLITILVVLLARHFAEPWMQALHPGFNHEQSLQAASLFQSLSTLMIWNSLSGLARAWNHGLGRFAITGFATVIGNGATLLLAWQRGAGSIDSVAQAVSFGAMLAFAVQMPWFQVFSRGWPVTAESQAGLTRCVRMLIPLIFILTCSQLDSLLDRYLASQLPPGGLSQLGYASRLASAVLTLSGSGLAMVAYPAIARHVSGAATEQLRTEIAAALRFLMILLVPVLVALILFSPALIRDLLERGRFHAEDTRAVASLLTLLCGMILGGALGEIGTKVFFSWRETRTPLLIGVLGFTVGATLKWATYRTHGVLGLALATSIYYLMNASLLWLLIGRRLGCSVLHGVLGSLGRALVSSAVAAGIGAWCVRWNVPFPSLLGAILGAIGFGVTLLILNDEFAWRAWRVVVPDRSRGASS